ncbi:lectin-like domain-containing protein, partial [Pedobacter cryoconitis]
MNKPLRFKLLTKFTSLIHSLTAQVNRRGIPARKWFVPIVSVGLFILFILNPFSSRAQFPYEETFKNSTTNKPDVKFGGEPTAFLTALRPITGSVTDKEGEGYLRLTNNTKKQKGYVYSNNVFLGTYGLNIEFEYFTYKGDTDGADGLCFFLFDAAVPDAGFNIGGFGGSLGYAQLYKDKTFFSGVSKGYLGIGLDEFGNFSNHNENRQGDKDQIPNSVTIRGAGDGSANDPSNYPLIETVKTSSLKTDAFDIGGGSRTATDGDPKYRKVLINLVPRTGGGLLISVSVKHGSVVTPVIVKFPYTTPIPAKGLKYGIASSTGDNVNYHEIRGLKLTVDENVLSQPEAPSPSMNICQRENGVLDILTGATRPNAGGEPNPDNVDLNPLTPEIDRKVITPAGTFEFDNINTKKLLYTPAPGYSGSSAAIQFTFMDVYGAKSTVGTATFNISSPIITVQPVSGTICENSNFTATVTATGGSNLSYQWEYPNSNGDWISLPDPDGKLGAQTSTLHITNAPFTYSGNQYRVKVSSPGGCIVISDIIKLTVNQLPTSKISPYQQGVCIGSPDIPITFSGENGVGPYTFSYTISDGTVTSAIKTLTTSNSSKSITINHPTNVAGVFTYEIVNVSNSTCSNVQSEWSEITIKPNPSVELVPLSGDVIQSLCVGMTMKPIVYQVKDAIKATMTLNTPNPEIKFFYDIDKKTITISGVPSTFVGKFPFTVNILGGCSPLTTTGEINILPNTTIALNSAVNTDQQQPCINTPITKIEYLVTNGKGAVATGLPAELVPFYDNATGKFTITGTPLTAGLISYTVTASGDCEPAIIHGTINVKPDITIALTSAVNTAQQQPCINTPINKIEYLVTNGKTAIATGLPAELSGIYDPATGKFTITGTPLTAGLISYTVTASGDCEPAITHGTINVKPDVTIALTSAVNTDQQQPCINHAITPIEYQVTHGNTATVTGLP